MEYNRVQVSIGSFNWADPSTKQVCLRFFWREDAPEDVKKLKSLVVWNPDDGPTNFDSALDAMGEAVSFIDRCLYNSDKEVAHKARIYLDIMALRDERDMLLAKREALENNLARVNEKLRNIDRELDEEVSLQSTGSHTQPQGG